MTRRQRQRAVTIATFVLLLCVLAVDWHRHGWQRAAYDVGCLIIVGVALVLIITWESRGKP